MFMVLGLTAIALGLMLVLILADSSSAGGFFFVVPFMFPLGAPGVVFAFAFIAVAVVFMVMFVTQLRMVGWGLESVTQGHREERSVHHRCAFCERSVPSDAVFCPYCGIRIQEGQ
ncbi:MAG: zinc ribbon domain-containing protein [Candidatus Thorarchaeota archaeon]|nr:zinc ribbon domain-containing protein [Candidatus Thorarchaeota archaeon]